MPWGGKYIFTCFYVVTDLFFLYVCLFCYLSFHLGFLGCPSQRVFTSFYSFSVSFMLCFLFKLSHFIHNSDTCELATSLFKIVGVYLASLLCFHPFFTAPSHTALLEFLSLLTLAQRTALLSLFHSVSNKHRNRSVVFGFISNCEKGNASEAALSLLLCSTSH